MENLLFATDEGVYFKIHEEFYGLLDDLRIRHNLMVLGADNEPRVALHDMPIFEILFVYKNRLCGINSDLISVFNN